MHRATISLGKDRVGERVRDPWEAGFKEIKQLPK
jgi:hypothetical protein